MASQKLLKLMADLKEERATLVAKSSPLRKKRDALKQSIAQEEAQIYDLNQAIKQTEGSRLYELDMEIAALAKATGARTMSAQSA